MTWTTLTPDGAMAPIGAALMALMLATMVYSLGLLYRLTLFKRLGGLSTPAEDLEDEEP